MHSRTKIVEDTFVYHVSEDCYKKYVHLDTKSPPPKPASSFTDIVRKPDYQLQLGLHLAQIQINMIQSVLSADKSSKDIYKKFKLCESDCAKIFLGSTLSFQNDVYTRICDLDHVTSVYGADLLFHNNCIRSYLMRYERKIEDNKNNDRVTERAERENL